MRVVPLLSAVTATGAGSTVEISKIVREIDYRPTKRTFHGMGAVSSSTGSATIVVQVSNDGENWLTLGTITLSLTTSSSSDGFSVDSPWAFVRGNVTAISGTGASVSLVMGV